jgi:hypothetical protein
VSGALSAADRGALRLQLLVARLAFPILWSGGVAWLRFVKRLTVPRRNAIRRQFREIIEQSKGPIIVCSNHLTLVDTMVIVWVLAGFTGYVARFRRFPWSLPEKQNFPNNIPWRIVSYIGKSLFVIRRGPREKIQRVMAKIEYLLARGEALSIFPEGARSRTGRVDTTDFAYGVGQIVQAAPDPRVICLYVRGRAQRQYTSTPHTGDEIYVELAEIRPTTESPGMRGARDIARQVIQKLADMEADFFRATRPDWQ